MAYLFEGHILGPRDVFEFIEFIQTFEVGIAVIVFVGAAIIYLMSLEIRQKSSVLNQLAVDRNKLKAA